MMKSSMCVLINEHKGFEFFLEKFINSIVLEFLVKIPLKEKNFYLTHTYKSKVGI
jgi:hypothetical protein